MLNFTDEKENDILMLKLKKRLHKMRQKKEMANKLQKNVNSIYIHNSFIENVAQYVLVLNRWSYVLGIANNILDIVELQHRHQQVMFVLMEFLFLLYLHMYYEELKIILLH